MKGLRRSGLLGKVVGKNRLPGSLCGLTDDKTIERARQILNRYFEAVYDANPARWEDSDSYICINPAIRAHLAIIAETVDYLTHKKSKDFSTISEAEYATAPLDGDTGV